MGPLLAVLLAVLVALAFWRVSWPSLHVLSFLFGVVVMVVVSWVFQRWQIQYVERQIPNIKSLLDSVLRSEPLPQQPPLLAEPVSYIAVGVIRLFHMVLTIVVGQVMFMWKTCTGRWAAIYFVPLEVAWGHLLLFAVGLFMQSKWVTHVPWQIALMTLWCFCSCTCIHHRP